VAIKSRHLTLQQGHAIAIGLPPEFLQQLRTRNAMGKAGIIMDLGNECRPALAAVQDRYSSAVSRKMD
jgi:hypothetical protein